MTKEEIEKMNSEHVKSIRRHWNAPRRHVENYEQGNTQKKRWPDPAEAVLLKLKALKPGWICALLGGPGLGKTQMAVDLMFSVTHRSIPLQPVNVYFMSAMEFFIRIKSAMSPKAEETTEGIMKNLRCKKLLVIEEISRRAQTDFENNLLFELINTRYSDKTNTLLIDNSTPQMLAGSLDAALLGRIKETGGIVECNWPSFR